jgi:hypothetical protein
VRWGSVGGMETARWDAVACRKRRGPPSECFLDTQGVSAKAWRQEVVAGHREYRRER